MAWGGNLELHSSALSYPPSEADEHHDEEPTFIVNTVFRNLKLKNYVVYAWFLRYLNFRNRSREK
jgi:hypothetical protein